MAPRSLFKNYGGSTRRIPDAQQMEETTETCLKELSADTVFFLECELGYTHTNYSLLFSNHLLLLSFFLVRPGS